MVRRWWQCPLRSNRKIITDGDVGRSTATQFDSEEPLDPGAEEFGMPLHFGALGKGKRVLDVDPGIANCNLDLGIPKQDLNSPQVSCLLIDDGCLRSAQRMSAIVLPTQSDANDPLVNQPSVLPGAEYPSAEGRLPNPPRFADLA
jgi:hypothetical protein